MDLRSAITPRNCYASARDGIVRLLEYIGEDVNREGLMDTPDRVLHSYGELFSGYTYREHDIEALLKTFEDNYDEMVVAREVEFFSTCEHHMLPFIGRAHIAYIPDGRIVGLSKLPRLLEVYARRLQVQERLTVQVTEALDKFVTKQGSACVVEAKHLCMACRGVGKQHSSVVTSSLTGKFRNAEVRQELFSLIGRRR